MYNCSNCGSVVNQGETFCRGCGTKLAIQTNFSNSVQNIQNVNPSVQGYQQPQNVVNGMINDDVLINAYIGKNYEKLRKGNSSLLTFVFGFIYVWYRKMWLLGFAWLVVNIIISLFLPTFDVLNFFLNVVMGVKFKKIYVEHVIKEVEKIKAENPGKTQDQLMLLCNKKGGTAAWVVVLYYLLCFLTGIVVGIAEFYEENENNFDSMGNGAVESISE